MMNRSYHVIRTRYLVRKLVEEMESQASEDILDKGIDEWSDLKCIQIACEDQFPEVVKNLNIQKQIISRFLNFYLSGKIQKGVTVTDVIFSSIAIMPRDISVEEPMWRNVDYSEEGTLFFLTPEDKLQAEIKSIINNQNEKALENNEESEATKSPTIAVEAGEEISEESPRNELKEEMNHDSTNETQVINEEASESGPANEVHENKSKSNEYEIFEKIKWFREKQPRSSANMKRQEYSSTENAAFCSHCSKILKEWDTNEQARIVLKFFFGLTALTLMRTITKSYENVINVFSSPQFSCHISQLHYSPPDKMCVIQCFKTFRRSDRKTLVMFAKLILNSYILDRTPSSFKIKNVIKLGLLSHTAYFKMDLINMMETVNNHSYQTFHIIMKVLCEAEELSASMRRVCDYIKKYLCVSETNYLGTCYWAAILERGQFKELSCRENYNLAVVVAVFIEKLTYKQGIWNAKWVKQGDDLEANKQLGLNLYKSYCRRRDEEACKALKQQLFCILLQ